jgi:hypothetical protein
MCFTVNLSNHRIVHSVITNWIYEFHFGDLDTIGRFATSEDGL